MTWWFVLVCHAADLVAVGDLHGDLAQTKQVLELAGVVDTEGHWSGGDTVLVQTGDVFDRGDDGKAIMDLFDQLRVEAPKAGGEVIQLLGNHEVMNLLGDWRYVSPGDVAAYGGEEARKQAFRGGAEEARLQELNIVAKVGDTVFTHGGVTPEFAAWGVDRINADAQHALAQHQTSRMLGADGPTWFRGYVQSPDCQAARVALASLGAERMVVGHTTQRDGRIRTFCEGRVTVIDIGIAAGYGGHLGVWVLRDGMAYAKYPGREEPLPNPGTGE